MFLVDALKVDYPLVMTNIAIENGPVEIVSFPINSMVDLSIVFCKFTRGYRIPNLGDSSPWVVSLSLVKLNIRVVSRLG